MIWDSYSDFRINVHRIRPKIVHALSRRRPKIGYSSVVKKTSIAVTSIVEKKLLELFQYLEQFFFYIISYFGFKFTSEYNSILFCYLRRNVEPYDTIR